MRINIVTTGRYHVLDLARELAALGHEVRFYSYVPRRRAEKFGLPRECHRSLLPFVFPLLLVHRFMPRLWNNGLALLLDKLVDTVAAWRMEPCDVLIGMSGICVKSLRVARERYGAMIFLERGSRHILSQKEILEGIPGTRKPPVTGEGVERELMGYDFADVIVVPSRHVVASFLERGIPESKLFRNPYGVDLRMFSPKVAPENKRATLIFAGTWSMRKGGDVLMKAVEGQPWRVLHVGGMGDAPVPDSTHFEDRGFVPQWKLAEVYAEGDVLVLPSREEGLAVVLAQGLACGLPLVCSDRTGGEDLGQFLEDPSVITVVPTDDVEALRRGIETTLARARERGGRQDLLGASRERLSWRGYGERYSEELERAAAMRKKPISG